MNWRAFLGALIAGYIAIVLIVAGAKAIWPPERYPIQIDAPAYAAQYRPKAKPIIIQPAPKPVPPPKHHRLKTKLDPFKRFEFDQRSIV